MRDRDLSRVELVLTGHLVDKVVVSGADRRTCLLPVGLSPCGFAAAAWPAEDHNFTHGSAFIGLWKVSSTGLGRNGG